MPPVTVCDEPWPLLHFWRHHFWPKFASSILNFCRRKRSFQWCLDQSDRPNGAWDMHKNAQKVEWKTQSKISCHYTWLLHGKNCPPRWRFLRSFLTASKPSRSHFEGIAEESERDMDWFEESAIQLVVTITRNGEVGRPRLALAREQLETLHGTGYPWHRSSFKMPSNWCK